MDRWFFTFEPYCIGTFYVKDTETLVNSWDAKEVLNVLRWEDTIPVVSIQNREVRGNKLPDPHGTDPHGTAPVENTSKSAWNTQVGGDHYKKLKIQPMMYSMANGLDPLQHTVVKYVTRFRDKNGIEDLRKAIQTIELLIEYEEINAA